MSDWGTWSQQPVRRSYAVGGTSIEFLNLDAEAYMLEIKGLQHGNAAPTDLLVQLSTDGVTWDVTPANYIVGGGTSILKGLPLNTSWPLDTYYAGYVPIEQFVSASARAWMTPFGGRLGNNTGARGGSCYNTQLVTWSALRITTELGHTFTKNMGVLLRERRSA